MAEESKAGGACAYGCHAALRLRFFVPRYDGNVSRPFDGRVAIFRR
jgi:hypothetical protein